MSPLAQTAIRMSRPITFKFDPAKALEVLLYIATRVADPGFHRVSKILYFADREHLARYGRFICGDSYVAMKHGPVPSGSYDILKHVRGDGLPCPVPGAQAAFRVDDGKLIVPLRESRLECLSASDRECLDAAIANYGKLSFSRLTQLSHDQAWDSADENEFIAVEQIVATLPDADELLRHLADPYPD